MRHLGIFTLAVVVATGGLCRNGQGAEPNSHDARIVVEGTRLTFDPKRVTRGRGRFYWGLGSVRVTLLGHRAGHCVFDYQWEVEGAGSYEVRRVRVPLTSGPVVIDAGKREGPAKHHWSHVHTSFTVDQATLIRRTGVHGWIEEPVEGTGELVAYRTHCPGKAAAPGSTAPPRTLRFTVYTAGDFRTPHPGAQQGEEVVLPLRRGRDWKWVTVAAAGISPGEVRQVRLPARIAGGARRWLPGAAPAGTLYLEMERAPSRGRGPGAR